MPGEFETEAEDVRVRARQDATTLADARGAFAQRPRVLVEARDRNDFHDRARPASQMAAARGYRDNGEQRNEARGEFDTASTAMKQSAEEFADARDEAEVTLGDTMMALENLETDQESAQERYQQADGLTAELRDRKQTAQQRAEQARESHAADPAGEDDEVREAEQAAERVNDQWLQAADQLVRSKQDTERLGALTQRVRQAGAALEEELTIAKSPSFEGWGVDDFLEQQELRSALNEVDQGRKLRTAADQRQGQRQRDERRSKKTILGGVAGGAISGTLLGGGLGAVVGGIVGLAFFGNVALGAGIGAAGGALLGGLAGAGGGALFGAVSAKRARSREARAREAGGQGSGPQAAEGEAGSASAAPTTGMPREGGASDSDNPAAKREERASVPASPDGVDDLLERLDDDAQR